MKFIVYNIALIFILTLTVFEAKAHADSDSVYIFTHQLTHLSLNKKDFLGRKTGYWVDSCSNRDSCQYFIRYRKYKHGSLNGNTYILYFFPFTGGFDFIIYRRGQMIYESSYCDFLKMGETRDIRRNHIRIKNPDYLVKYVPKYIGYEIVYYGSLVEYRKSFPKQVRCEGYTLFDDDEDEIEHGIWKYYNLAGTVDEIRIYDAGKLIKKEEYPIDK